mgnify:CR=1 FL=1
MINIDEGLLELGKKCEEEIKTELKKIDDICMFNSMKVLNAFHEENISEIHFNTSTGYGYNDIGRDKIEDVYKRIFKCEDALVRTQFISGSHALTVCLFGLLRPNDTLLSITGKPYDTLDEVIGITPNDSSLKSFGVNYEQIDLVDNNFDFKKIEERLNKDFVKVIEIQRSKGYSTRKSITIDKLEEVISFIKKTINLAKTVVKSIDNEAVSEVIYWVILLVIVIVCSVALRTIVNYCMKVIRNYIKPKLCDRYSAIMFLITITVFVNFSRQIKRLINVNLILIEGIIMSAYGAIRLFFTSKDIRRRNTLLIYIIGVIGVISLIHILIKY